MALSTVAGGGSLRPMERLGIVGLPNVGKSTLFNALTQASIPADVDLGIENRRFDIGAGEQSKTLATVEERSGPVLLMRYNMYPAAAINVTAAPGVSSGQAITIMDTLTASEMPPGFGFEWTELTYQEIADQLQLPEGTVKSRINRGRTELARQIQKLREQQDAIPRTGVSR